MGFATNRTARVAGVFLILVLPTAKISAQQTLTSFIDQPLTLPEAISQSLRLNPSSLSAMEQVSQAEAAVKQSQAPLHFQLTFNSEGGVSNANVIQPPPSSETFGAIQNSLTVPIPVGPKDEIGVRQAVEALAAAKMVYLSSETALSSKVAAAYFDLLRKRALVKAAQLDLETSQRELSDAQARKAAGDIPELDVQQAQVPAAVNQAALLTAQSAESVAQETLNDLLCRPLDDELAIQDTDTAPSAPNFSLSEARTMTLAASPDVAAADAAVRQSEAAEAAARHYNDPSLSLQAIDLRSGDQTSFSREDTLQAGVAIPLDDGGLQRAVLQSAVSATNQAKLVAESARKSAIAAVSAAYLQVESSLAEVAATSSAQDIAQSTYEKTRLGYTNGLYPLVDALTAEKAAADARAAYIQSLYDAAQSRYTLDIDVNGLFANKTMDINPH
jgi:adhesin transport system outer membrane protein